jgi:hypothetical protein
MAAGGRVSNWWKGPSNAIDRLILLGEDAVEISYLLSIPLWVVRERFAVRAAQLVPAWADAA